MGTPHGTNGALEPRALPIVGDHLALDFANTVDDPEGHARFDHIATFPGLLTWATDRGVVTAAQATRIRRRAGRDADAAQTTLERAHVLRDVVAAVFTSVASGDRPTPGEWRQLRWSAADALRVADLRIGPHGGELGWPRTDDAETVLWPVAVAALDLLRSPDLQRIKRCGGCPWLFVDRSRNGSRRWCAMADCGTHEKIRRYLNRRADQRRTTASD